MPFIKSETGFGHNRVALQLHLRAANTAATALAVED